MRVLVTGGAGYIGSHTLVELMGQAHAVCVLDNYDNASPEVLNRVRALTNGTMTDYTGDIRDSALLDTVMTDFKPDVVIHFAGLKAVGESMRNPLGYYDVNLRGTLQLLAAMDRHKVRRMIFSSSATVYGDTKNGAYHETDPTNPMSVYGRTKLMSEQIINDWSNTHSDACAILLRYFNPVGAHASTQIGEHPDGVPNNLMPYIAQVAVGTRKELQIFGDDYDTPDGTGMRDYIHVVDLARAHVAAVEYTQTKTGTQVFNIGTGTSYSVHEMVAAFAKACGHDIPYVIKPRRAGDIATMQADPTRANTKLGWRATHTLDDMVRSTWNWQSANPHGYADS